MSHLSPEHARLRDGALATIRPYDDADRPALARFVEALSGESRRLRFHSAGTRVDPESLLGGRGARRFVALVGGELVGVGCYVPLTAPHDAEVALAVRDDEQGRGVGTRLVEQLAEAARREGFHELLAVVLSDNRQMLNGAPRPRLPASSATPSAARSRCGSTCATATATRTPATVVTISAPSPPYGRCCIPARSRSSVPLGARAASDRRCCRTCSRACSPDRCIRSTRMPTASRALPPTRRSAPSGGRSTPPSSASRPHWCSMPSAIALRTVSAAWWSCRPGSARRPRKGVCARSSCWPSAGTITSGCWGRTASACW